MHIFDIEGDGLTVELSQTWTLAIAIVVNKYISLDLTVVSVSKQHKGEETENSQWVDSE
jgi:hypothetical protein